LEKLRYKLLQNGNSIEAKAIAMSYRFLSFVVYEREQLNVCLRRGRKNRKFESIMEESVGSFSDLLRSIKETRLID